MWIPITHNDMQSEAELIMRQCCKICPILVLSLLWHDIVNFLLRGQYQLDCTVIHFPSTLRRYIIHDADSVEKWSIELPY
jgi:hypothetical protein